jgi:hypothetical protein
VEGFEVYPQIRSSAVDIKYLGATRGYVIVGWVLKTFFISKKKKYVSWARNANHMLKVDAHILLILCLSVLRN